MVRGTVLAPGPQYNVQDTFNVRDIVGSVEQVTCSCARGLAAPQARSFEREPRAAYDV